MPEETKSKYLNKLAIVYPNGDIWKGLTRKEAAACMQASKPENQMLLFDSQKEAEFYVEVLLPGVRSGKWKVEFQPKYILQESFRKEGKHNAAITYSPDFRVTLTKTGAAVCYDVKGFENDRFPLKRKMFDFKFSERLVVIKHVKKFGGWIDEETYKKKKKEEAASKK